MTIRFRSILFIFALLFVTFVFTDVSAADSGRKAAVLVGGWSPIENVSAPEVQDVAQFAITEHNKEAGTNLTLQSVVSGETQVVSGTNYKLVIEATDGAVSGDYEAVVWVKPWLHYQNLTSFRQL